MTRKWLWTAKLAAVALLATLLSPMSTAGAAPGDPRILLDAAKLSWLRQRAQANDPAWVALRQKCDGHVGGQVEWPNGNDYPGGNNIGEGFQGDEYFPPLVNLALCYRVAQTIDPAQAAKYGARGVDVLFKMSSPDINVVDPMRNQGYAIRFYGLGMALGYDWLYPAMTAADRTRVYTALNRWIDAWEAGSFARNHPQGNYFAGYYATKAVAALATEGANPRAAAMWTDFLNRVHGQMVQPHYAANLEGGGWPEGQNYGPLATFNMLLPVLAAKTAKGIDLFNGQAPFRYGSGAAKWYMYNIWPSLLRVDDRGTMRIMGEPAPSSAKVLTQLSGMLPTWNDPLAPAFHRFTRDVRTANPGVGKDLWSEFLFWDANAAEADYKTGPLASLAHGMEMGAVRSSWNTDAVWGSLNAGPYTGSPNVGEQLFDSGSLAIARGNTPFLVNAGGQLYRGTTSPGQFIYDDNFTGSGTRGLYNVFSTNTPTPTGQGARTRASGVLTTMSAFDQTQDYVFMRAGKLEGMYPRPNVPSTVSSWTRDVVYLRPNIFVVYDRTTTTSSGVGQWMRWHFAGAPAKTTDPSTGVSRYNIGSGSTYAGSVSTLLPAGHQEQVTPAIFNGSNVSRIDVRPSTAAAENRWLAVFDANANPANAAQATRLSAADGNVLAGAVTGALLRSSGTNYVVLGGTGAADSVVATPVRYRIPAQSTRHVITGLAPNTTYAVSTTPGQDGVAVQVTQGSGPKTSSAGVLTFTTS